MNANTDVKTSTAHVRLQYLLRHIAHTAAGQSLQTLLQAYKARSAA